MRFLLSVMFVAGALACTEDDTVPVPGCVADDPAAAFASQLVFAQDGGSTGCHWTVSPGAEDWHAAGTAFLEARPGQTICFTEGTFKMKGELSLESEDVTVRGAGKDKTTLDFAGQAYGAQGITVRSDGFTIRDLRVLDTKGDAIKTYGVSNVTFLNVTAMWTADSSAESGAYALYPVNCKGVRVEGCTVKGARDAGIYVGQSTDILVKDNDVYGNVAGIEIENSTEAEVVGNHAHDNSGGILVFNLPGLPVKNGKRANVHDNVIENNNLENFAPPGNLVGKVPAGSGIIVLAADENEVHHNTITGNVTLGIVLARYDSGLFGSYDDPAYDTYCEGNYVHDNTFSGNGTDPQGAIGLILKETAKIPLPFPAMLDSGCVDPEKAPVKNCFKDNGDAGYGDIQQCNEFKDPKYDVSAVTCTRDPLPARDACVANAHCDGAALKPEAVTKTTCEVPYPKLSDYHFFVGPMKEMAPAEGVLPYDVNAPLWADHAGKGRFIALPAGQAIGFDPTGDWTFPTGTILVKTFYFDLDRRDGQEGAARVVETRLLIKGETGWTAHTYTWNAEETDAIRSPAGKEVVVAYTDEAGAPAQQTYLVPSTIQCGNCHERNHEDLPLGTVARQLDRTVTRDGKETGQLAWLASKGAFSASLPAAGSFATLADPYAAGPAEPRARAFLDANCAHCHRNGGAAGSTGLWLAASETDKAKLGICKTPVAAGSGAGTFKYDIVPGQPDQSILTFRLASTDPGIKMPELPNLQVDSAGLSVIQQWIAEMSPAGCP